VRGHIHIHIHIDTAPITTQASIYRDIAAVGCGWTWFSKCHAHTTKWNERKATAVYQFVLFYFFSLLWVGGPVLCTFMETLSL